MIEQKKNGWSAEGGEDATIEPVLRGGTADRIRI